jgi:PAS domain S-box-containing protein
VIIDIVRTHPVVLVSGVLQENPFYVPPDEFLAELRARDAGSRPAGAGEAPDAAEVPYRYGGRLSNTLRDLVALGTLSALEGAREPTVTAEHFAEAVLSLPSVEMVFVNADFPPHWSGVEVLRVRDDLRPAPSVDDLRRTVVASAEPRDVAVRRVVGDFAGLGALSLFVIPLGPDARYGWVAAGSRRQGFPDDLPRALLEVGAQQLSAGLRDRYLADLRVAEAARREAEERFRLAFEHAAVGMALLTPEGRFVQVNPALCRILGREETDLLATDWQSVTEPEDLRHSLDAVRRLVAGEMKSVILANRCVRSDGAVVWVQNSLSITRDASGRPRHVVVLMEDITDQRRGEEALRVSEARFSRLFRNSPAALGMGTIPGRMIDANDHWLELFGYRRDEVIGHTVSELNLWADPGERAGVVERMLRDGVVRDLETRFRRKSGEIREALLTFVRAELPGEEEPVMMSMLLDVTDRRRAEVERARLNSITDAALAYLSLNDLLRELLARLRSALRAEFASFQLIDEEAQELVLRAVDGVPFERMAGIRIPLESSSPVRLDAPYVVDELPQPDPGSDDWYARWWSAVGLPLRAGMGVPLLVEGKPIGVVNVASTRTPFTEEDQRLLRVVADRVARAIERGRLVETVGESRRRLAVLSQRLVEVQETERREIARELHDEVGQLLTGLLFMIEGHGSGAGNLKDEMKGVVKDLIERVRDLSMNLRPPMLDDLGLLAALTWQIDRFEAQTGVSVRFHHAGLDRRFGAQVEITAFRIVQEALTNVARHAGVRQAKVDVWANPVSLGVRIEDEGRGFDVEAALAARSSGLEGMRERSRLAGGRLAIESEPGEGTRLSVELPLDHASLPKEDEG